MAIMDSYLMGTFKRCSFLSSFAAVTVLWATGSKKYPFDFGLNRGVKGNETAGITNSKPRISLPFTTKSQNKSGRILAALPAIGLLAYATAAFAVPADFDSDGLSDRVAVQILDNGDLRWRAKGDDSDSSLGIVGRVGDHLILGRWTPAETPVVGFIRRSGNAISWNVRSSGQDISTSLGGAADLAVGGADFDGDGIKDAAVVRTLENRLRWTVKRNPFNSDSTTNHRHGKPGDISFFIRIAGPRDGAAVLRRPESGPLRVLARDLTTNRVRKINRISRSLWSHGRPAPLTQPGGGDVLVFSRKTNAFTVVTVIGQDGKRIFQTRVEESVDTVIGEFLSDPGQEFAFATSSGFTVFNPFSRSSATIESPTGIAADHININSFASSNDPDLPAPRDTCYELSPSDGYKIGFIWKPASDTQFGAVVILPGRYLNKVSGVKTTRRNGDLIRTMSFKGNANPDPGNVLRPHYIDRSLQGDQYRRQFGSIIVEVGLTNGACLHYPIDNPAQRAD